MFEALVASQIILWLVVLALVLVILALARQIGVLHERIAPMGALMMDRGIEIGQPVPVREFKGLTGERILIGGNGGGRKSLLLLFLSPKCPLCKKLLPILKSFARAERRELEVVLVSDGSVQDNQRLVREEFLEDFPYLISPELGMTYQIGKLPYAALISEKGILRAKGLVNNREHLDSLMEAKETGFRSAQDFMEAQGTEESRSEARLASTD